MQCLKRLKTQSPLTRFLTLLHRGYGYGGKKIFSIFSLLWIAIKHRTVLHTITYCSKKRPCSNLWPSSSSLNNSFLRQKKRAKTFKLGIQIILSKQKNILEKNLIGMCIVFMGIVLGDLAKFTNYLHIS